MRDLRAAWTSVGIGAVLVAIAAPMGFVTSRSRGTPAPERARAPHEPPPSPLVAPVLSVPAAAGETRSIPAGKAALALAHSGGSLRAPAPAPAELARLEVRVLRAGRAEPEARVELLHEARNGASASSVHTSDAMGLLRLFLAPGTVRAVAWSGESCALPASATLELDAPAYVELTLEPAFPVAGRVLDARNGLPLAGATVALWTFAEHDTVTSGADGSFRHPRFPGGAPAQQLVARAAGHGQSVRYLRIGADGGWRLSAASTGEPSTKGTGLPWVELWLVPELRVRGRVQAACGRPLAGARVRAEGFFRASPSVASLDAAEIRCDAEGTFELGGLRSDIGHSLLIEAAGFAHALHELGAGATELELETLVLLPETLLAGVAIDGDGLPLAGIEVVLRTLAPGTQPTSVGALDVAALDVGARLQGRERRARTSPEGTFVFEHLTPGPVRLSLGDGETALELFPRPDGSFESPCLVASR